MTDADLLFGSVRVSVLVSFLVSRFAVVSSLECFGVREVGVTTPLEIILYYRLNHSIWSLSDNKESSR
jgi:hypothetical protein